MLDQHVVVNLTWRCQLKCPYCWLPHTKINRSEGERTAAEWAQALTTNLEGHAAVDFSGGEPLLFPGIVDLCCSLSEGGLWFAMTTNGLNDKAIDELIARRPLRCAIVNVSDHNGNRKTLRNYERLKDAGCPLKINRVVRAATGTWRDDSSDIPFQDWERGLALDGKGRLCSAGIRHWAADPTGEVWRCMVAMQTGQPSIGNLFDGTFRPLLTRRSCAFGCSTCYRERPQDWLIVMEEWD